MTRSASATARATAPRLLASVTMRPWWIWSTHRSRSRFLSSSSTSASMPCAIHARVPADVAGAEHHDARRPHAGDAAEQHAAPAELALEEPRADLGGHASRDLAHRREQRERAVVGCTVSYAMPVTLVLEQRVGDLRVRGEVEVGEEHEVGPEVAELVVLRLLHLQDHPGAAPDVVGARRRSPRPRPRYSSSVIAESTPASRSTRTVTPWAT